MDKDEVIDLVRAYGKLLEQYIDVKAIYLYGSYAKGNFSEHSDIDVAVVVESMGDDYFTITPLLWRLRRGIDHRIEPVLFVKDNDASGFLTEISAYGIKVA